MAINYASKYSEKVAEKFKLKSMTDAAINKDYEWLGVTAINVYSVPTQALNDYVTTANSVARYGTPTDLQNTIQTMTLSKDRAFSTIIDARSNDDTNGVMDANKFLSRQMDLVIVPEIDTYRLGVIAAAAIAAGGTDTAAAVTASNAYSLFLAGQEYLGNNAVPLDGRVAFVSYAYYSFLKKDTSFILASDIAMDKRINGQVGMVDGVKIVPVPSSYLPTNTSFIITHPQVTVAAEKLKSFTIQNDPMGVNGNVVEGRIRYDAFVLDAKKTGCYIHKTA